MSDKRTVSTDALETLGMIHTREEKRDAIHLAVMPVEAGDDLAPGEDIQVKDGIATEALFGDAVGIVDPFLRNGPRKGQRFWLVIYPRKIQSLRHVWSHPGIPDEAGTEAPAASADAQSAAKAAVHELAESLGISSGKLMEGAAAWLDSGGSYDGYMLFGHDLDYGWDMDKFWNAYALLTGRAAPENLRTSFFSCSC